MKRLKQTLASNLGFSLVELMVAVSILAAVALAAAGVANMMAHANDYSDRK